MLKSTLALTTRSLYPAAYWWARPGYFGTCEWGLIEARRIALVACHWLGDTLWATQVLTPLRARFPEAEFYALTKPAAADLWNGWLPRDHVLSAQAITSDMKREQPDWSGVWKLAREHRHFEWDLVIDLTGNQFSAIYSVLVRPGRALGFDGGLKWQWLYSHRVTDAARPGRHLSERPFRIIEPLLAETENPFPCPLFPRPPGPTCTFSELLKELVLPEDKPLYVLAPGAGWPEKEWPMDQFSATGQLLARQGGTVLVIGSPQQEALCRQVAARIDGAQLLLAPTIGRANAALHGSAGVVANDSGPAHLAAAYGRRTAVIFTGATDPQLCRPLGPENQTRIFSSQNAAPENVAAFLLT